MGRGNIYFEKLHTPRKQLVYKRTMPELQDSFFAIYPVFLSEHTYAFFIRPANHQDAKEGFLFSIEGEFSIDTERNVRSEAQIISHAIRNGASKVKYHYYQEEFDTAPPNIQKIMSKYAIHGGI